MRTIKVEKNHRYLTISVYAFFTALAVIICYLMLSNLAGVGEKWHGLISVLKPFIWGISLAYVLNPLMVWAERRLKKTSFFKERSKGRRAIAILFSLLVLVLIVSGLFALVIPELSQSLTNLAGNFSVYVANAHEWINNILIDYMERLSLPEGTIDAMLQPLLAKLSNMENWTEYLTVALPAIFNFLLSAVISLKDIIIALIMMIYLLAGKERFLAQGRKLLYAYSNSERSREVLNWSARTNRIFSAYISGSIMDALVVGIMTFVILSGLRIEYAIVISVLIAVTNVIPFFGPFIGAIPSGFLLLLVSPRQCLIFIIVILIIQLLDGNVIKPRILGNSTGLSSFWVVFAVIVAGGLFGILGMFIGVPVFAVIYSFFKAVVERRLLKKDLSVQTEDYLIVADSPPNEMSVSRSGIWKRRRSAKKTAETETEPKEEAAEASETRNEDV